MRQQGDDKSVSSRAVLMEPLASDDDHWGHIEDAAGCAVEEQPAAGPESRNVDCSENETFVTCSRRVTDGKRINVLGDVDIGAVKVEPLQFHYSSNVVLPGDMVCDSMTVGTVLYSGSGITCLLERLAQQMEQHFRGERLVHLCV